MSPDMRQWDRIGKALANERKYAYVVELVVSGEALDVALSRRIVEFHKSRRIQPHHGRTTPGKDKTYFRWCFSDLATLAPSLNFLVAGFETRPVLSRRDTRRSR
jgi:hypothetical protein